MAISIKRIRRMAVAVKDLDQTIEHWKKMLNIEPFIRGVEESERYHWCAFHIGEGECTMEFLSPWKDPDGEHLIGKFIRTRGEGLYMVTLETGGTADETVDAMRELGIEPSWGSVSWSPTILNREGETVAMWQEHYIAPKHANGVLLTLATLTRKPPDVLEVPAADNVPIAGSKV